jgi:tyrosyl-tRNA synthetase
VTETPVAGPGGLLAELEWRGILHETTPGLPARLATGRSMAGYIGFDPSADSLHIGHLVPIFGLLRLQRFGGRPVAVVGGGTGMIGDPSGRSSERNLLDRETLERNVAAIRVQLERFLDFSPGSGGAVMVNNLDWLGELSLIEFLRDTGKHFTLPYMLSKDSVQVRLERGLSFTEFSYMLLQAYDFAHLHRTMGVELQMGGADQWGNITAGLELIRRTSGHALTTDSAAASFADSFLTSEGLVEAETLIDDASPEPAHGLAYKLLLAPSGTKFGKSEGGDSIWLDPHRTSPYAFYQYWVNQKDRDIGTYLRWFTEFPREQIEALEESTSASPEQRLGQQALAHDITARTHGHEVARLVERISRALFSRELDLLGPEELSLAAREVGRIEITDEDIRRGVVHLIRKAGLVTSQTEGRRLLVQGGLSVNERQAFDDTLVPPLLYDRFLILRRGPKKYAIAERVLS